MGALKLVADAISIFTILSCLFLKVPQIKNIRDKQSAEGMFVQAMIMEITGLTIVTLYNFTNGYSMLTYLEYPIILLQLYVLLFYTMLYQNIIDNEGNKLLVTSYICTVLGFLFGVLPKEMLAFMMPIVTPMNGFAKVTYIYGMIHAGSASTVSLSTWVISISTNLSRLFTIYMDSADPRLLFNLSISSTLSAWVLTTAIYYQVKEQIQLDRAQELEDSRRARRRRRSDYNDNHVARIDHQHDD